MVISAQPVSMCLVGAESNEMVWKRKMLQLINLICIFELVFLSTTAVVCIAISGDF